MTPTISPQDVLFLESCGVDVAETDKGEIISSLEARVLDLTAIHMRDVDTMAILKAEWRTMRNWVLILGAGVLGNIIYGCILWGR